MLHLHFIAESGIGSKQDLALFIHAVMHPWELGRKPDLVAAPGVRMQQAGAGFRPAWKAHEIRNCTVSLTRYTKFWKVFLLYQVLPPPKSLVCAVGGNWVWSEFYWIFAQIVTATSINSDDCLLLPQIPIGACLPESISLNLKYRRDYRRE